MTDLHVTEEGLPPLTRREALAEDAQIRTNDVLGNVRLFLFNTQKGWKALGYESFESYCRERDLPTSSLFKWRTRILESLRLHGKTVRWLRENWNRSTFDLEILPTRTAVELHKLPSRQMVLEVWEEYSSTRDLATGTEGANIKELQRIVGRYLRQSAPSQAVPSPDSSPATAPPPASLPAAAPAAAPPAPAALPVTALAGAPPPHTASPGAAPAVAPPAPPILPAAPAAAPAGDDQNLFAPEKDGEGNDHNLFGTECDAEEDGEDEYDSLDFSGAEPSAPPAPQETPPLPAPPPGNGSGAEPPPHAALTCGVAIAEFCSAAYRPQSRVLLVRARLGSGLEVRFGIPLAALPLPDLLPAWQEAARQEAARQAGARHEAPGQEAPHATQEASHARIDKL